MRILIAGYSYPDSFADNARSALERMGHRVRTLGDVAVSSYYSPARRLARRIVDCMRGGSTSADEAKLLRICREFRPELVMTLTREYAPDVLSEMKRISSPVLVMWWGDPPANARRWAFMDGQWDLVFLKDVFAVEKVRLLRSDVHLLDEAMNPEWHRPQSGQRSASLVVAGNCYAFRQSLIKRLTTDGVAVALYGAPPPRWALPEVRAAHQGRYIVRAEKSRIFGEGLACLNTFNVSEGNSLNCRAFEIAGSGGLQLIEYRPAIERCFDLGSELLTFRTYEELLECVGRAKNEPAEMRRIRDAGAKRALAEHTYWHRMKRIFEYL